MAVQNPNWKTRTEVTCVKHFNHFLTKQLQDKYDASLTLGVVVISPHTLFALQHAHCTRLASLGFISQPVESTTVMV